MTQDHITYAQRSQLTDGRDRPAAHAIETAIHGVNSTERTIRQATEMIRAKLTMIEKRLDHGMSLNDLGELQRMPAELDTAIALRQAHLAGTRRPAHRHRDQIPPAHAGHGHAAATGAGHGQDAPGPGTGCGGTGRTRRKDDDD